MRFMHQPTVCIVTQQYKSVLSGIGLHARNLLSGLLHDGYKVTLLTQKSQVDPTIPSNVQVIAVPDSRLESQARWIPLAWNFSRALHRLEIEHRFDIIHFTDAREAMFFTGHKRTAIGNANDYYAAQLMPPCYYRHYYTDWWKRWPYYVIVHQCEQFVLPRMRAIITNSDYTSKAIQQAYRLDPKNLFKCYKSIDLSRYGSKTHEFASEGMVLFVGGNMQRKGLETLIQAAVKVVKTRPSTKFRVVGTDPNLPGMQALCSRLHVLEYFEFIGWMPNEELQQLYRQASVFVMPSLAEAFGVVFLEAMACGVPVIGTHVGGIPELIKHGENGLLVKPDNPDELAGALLGILGDRVLSERLGENGRVTAQQYGIEQMITCTRHVYESLLGLP
jgi:glycosyltransferase involved in cell wall biosynthesis